jgi:hypothetical protein
MARQYRFTTTPKKLSPGARQSWGGSDGWSDDIGETENVIVENGTIKPNTDPPGPTDGLVTYYPFYDGDATDRIGENDGTITGASFLPDGGPTSDGAFAFDGAGQYINTNIDTPPSDGTITFWLYVPADWTGGVNNAAVWKGTSSQNWWGLKYGGDGDDWEYARYSSGYAYQFSNVTIPSGSWNHVALTWGTDNAAAYVNAGMQNSSTASTTLPSPSTIRLMQNEYDVKYVRGRLDGYRLYNRLLSKSEIESIYTKTQ